MGDLLANALIVIASHGLSLFELARLLQRDDYREGLLAAAPAPLLQSRRPDMVAFDAIAYRGGAGLLPVRVRRLEQVRARGGRRPRPQQVPRAAAHPLPAVPALRPAHHPAPGRPLAPAGPGAGPPGLRGARATRACGCWAACWPTSFCGRPCARTGRCRSCWPWTRWASPRSSSAGAAAKILAIARSRGLRLLVACQHLAQLSDGLRAALLANTAVQAFFRLGYADARLVAASLSAGTGERVSRVAADVAKRDADGLPEAWAEATHTVRDGRGEPVALSPAAGAGVLAPGAARRTGAAQVEGLKRLARVSGIDRLYVHAADTRAAGGAFALPAGPFAGRLPAVGTGLSGTGPMRLVVSFPRPRLSVLSRETEAERGQRWVKALTGLPVRRAVLRLAIGRGRDGAGDGGGGPRCRAGPGFERFLSAAVAGSGQSAREVEQAQAWRREEAERVAARRRKRPGPTRSQRQFQVRLDDRSGEATVPRRRPAPRAGSQKPGARPTDTNGMERGRDGAEVP